MVYLAILVSLGLSVIAIPVIRGISFRIGKVVNPRDDRWHRRPTPTLGGVGIFIATYSGFVILHFVYGLTIHWSLLVASVGMFLLGLYDDFRHISPPLKLIGQMVAATLVIYFGNLTIRFFPWPVANLLLTLFWLIGITNAINLLDNMDGIAGGISLIAAGFLAYFFWQTGAQNAFAFAVCLGGSALGFLIYNFPPARIFMGDSGSMFLGFTLSTLAIIRSSQASNVLAVIAVPVMIFLAPILDTTLVTVTRLLRGESPTKGGTDHSTHRLVAFGLKGWQVTLILYVVALIGGLAGLILENRDYATSLILVPGAIVILALLTAYLGRVQIIAPHYPAQPKSVLSRLVIELAYRRQVFEILLDLGLIGFSYYLALWTINGLDMTQASVRLYLDTWPVLMITAYLSMRIAGVYRSAWGYFGLDDVVRIGLAAIVAGLSSYLFIIVFSPLPNHLPEVFLIFSVYLLLSVGGSRMSFRLLDQIANKKKTSDQGEAVVIIGAGEPGELVLRWLESGGETNNHFNFRPLGILDNDPSLAGRSLRQVKIFGDLTLLEKVILEKKPAGVILAMPDLLSKEQIQSIVDITNMHGLWLRKLSFVLDPI